MGLLDLLWEKDSWERFFRYKSGRTGGRKEAEALRVYIDSEGYAPVLSSIARGDHFPLPERSVINKMRSGKQRVVYTYPPAENMVLKLLTWLLIRKYDGLFERNLWSFRPGRGAKDAVRLLAGTHGIGAMYGYRTDISNYFNSVDVDLLLPMLGTVVSDDPALYRFLSELLSEPCVMDRGTVRKEPKGIMAGTPLSSFYANIFLMDLDRCFAERKVLYARYSDDLILFAASLEEREEEVRFIERFLREKHLSVNPDKEFRFSPGDRWDFLGFSYQDGTVDIAEASRQKLIGKMRRKAKALRRWQMRKGLSGEKAAKAFVRAFNRKLFEETEDHELTWARWYFPVINTAASLAEIDHYAQDCIRYLSSGKRTKARFNVRYAEMKELGYRNLVHEYYAGLKRSVDNEGVRA